jgi:hypothetical protein
MQELDQGGGKSFSTVDELLADLNADDQEIHGVQT